ncbi:MAG: hypothetical protein ACFFB3_05815, partial [Candidatus Hodarchaeota archaeon]
MVYSQDMHSIKSKLETLRNSIGIYVIAGTVLIFISLYFATDGFEDFESQPAYFFWTIVILVALSFYFSSGRFLSNPEEKKSNSLRLNFYLFILSWVIAVVFNFTAVEEVYFDAILG